MGSSNGVQNYPGFLSTFNLISTGINLSNITGDECTETSMLSDESLLILGAMVAGLNLGGGLGNLLTGKPNDYFGRKVVIIASGVIMVIGGAIQTASFFSWMFIAGRTTAGFGFGLAGR
ncbi:uncharacterized protein LOC135346692 isoform X4 [Halichondria panicea]|uniref:uncharacterized protein LOC135346692 isoform X4 n=1 Tax=Halichondria panicea TaxID=6063 RepID=UPI00312B9561